MKKNILTDHQELFILENHRSLSVAELAIKANTDARHVYEYLYANNLEPLDKRKEYKEMVRNKYGKMFNVSQRSNWLI